MKDKIKEPLDKNDELVFRAVREAIAEYDINAPPLTKNRFANTVLEKLKQLAKESK